MDSWAETGANRLVPMLKLPEMSENARGSGVATDIMSEIDEPTDAANSVCALLTTTYHIVKVTQNPLA
jgi:hypothetical protein